MWVVFVLAAAAVLFAVAAVAVGRGGGLPVAPPDRGPARVPDAPLTAEDLAQTRFGVGLRGYRMGQVDALLERVQAELARRDERIERLESALRGTAASSRAGSTLVDRAQPRTPHPPAPGPEEPT